MAIVSFWIKAQAFVKFRNTFFPSKKSKIDFPLLIPCLYYCRFVTLLKTLSMDTREHETEIKSKGCVIKILT